MRPRPIPLLEPLLGGVWWVVGSLALPSGPGTAVMAAGLGVTGALVVGLRRGESAPLPPGGRARLIRIVATTVVLIAAVASLLPLVGLGELDVPVACVLTGAALFPGTSVVDERAYLLAGGLLLVVGAFGALKALDAGGMFYPQAVVGMVAAALVWLVGAYRTGLLAEVRVRR